MNLSPSMRDNESIEAMIQTQLSGNLALKVFIVFFSDFTILLQLSEQQYELTSCIRSAICITAQNLLPINASVQRTLPICHNNLQNLTENHANYFFWISVYLVAIYTLPISF